MELSGKATTTMDSQGRIRIPAKFRKPIEEKYGKEVFITSLDGEHIQIFPLEEWKETAKNAREMAMNDPTMRRFLIRINMSGIVREIDRWGRVLIHKELRDKLNVKNRATVMWKKNHLVLKLTSRR